MTPRACVTGLIWLLPLFCLAETAGGAAQPDTLTRPRYLLETVRVVARRPSATVGTVRVVDFPAQQGVAALNLYDGLQGIPGLTNTSGTKDESNLRLRGFRKNELHVLIDGRPLNAGYFGNVDLHQIAPAGIREIRIIKGPAASIYGPGTMGGVVNIITSDPDNRDWASLSLLTKRNNSNRITLSSSRRLGDFGYWIYAAREHHEGLVLSRDYPGAPFESGGVRNHSRKTQYDLQTRLDYQISPFSQIGLSAGCGYVPEKLLPSSVYALDYRAYKDWLRAWSTLEYENVISGSATLSALAYYDAARDTYEQYSDAAHQHLSISSQIRNHTLGLNPRLEWIPGEGHTVNAGLRAESCRSNRLDTGNYLTWTPHWLNIYNAFAQWEYRWTPVATLSVGSGISGHQSDLRPLAGFQAEPSGGLFLRWNDTCETSLSLGRNTAYPTMRQLFSADRGNPDLLPQRALKLEISHRQSASLGKTRLESRLSAYYNDTRDLIDVQEDQYQNLDRIRSWGAEASIQALPWPWWSSRLEYAALFWNGEDGYELTESPHHQIALRQDWILPWRLGLHYDLSFTGERLSADTADVLHTLPRYWLHAASLDWSFGRQKLALGLENIFDTHYETEYGYPAAGLNFFLRLDASL